MKNLYDKERDKINDKLKKLERQKLFQNELGNRQKQLNKSKKLQNELSHEISSNKRKIADLSKQLIKLREKYDDTERQAKLLTAREEMEIIDESTHNEKYTTKSLLHMLGNYKSDILKLKMKVERWKEVTKKLNMEEHDLDTMTKKLDTRLMHLIGDLKNTQVLALIKQDSTSINSRSRGFL